MQTVVVGTAGHIDHGKSALVIALTGTDPDRLKEEQQRGITIDLGFAEFTTGSTHVSFVDVPGHERFVRNMLAGAGGIDAVLLVVDACESVKAQTREHFEICRLLGIERGAIVLTKIDAADATQRARARAETQALVQGSFLDHAPILEVSARTGEGMEGLRSALSGLAGRASGRRRDGILRMPVDRAFSIRGFGSVVTGTLVSGDIEESKLVMVLPENRTLRVRGIQVHGSKVMSARAPQRVAVNLADVEARELRRGQTLATDGSLAVTNRADVKLALIEGAPPLKHGDRVRVYGGSSEWVARVSIAATRQSTARAWTPVRPGDSGITVRAGAAAFARLRFETLAAMTRGDRLVVRGSSPLTTIAGAVVLDPEPPPPGVRRSDALARFEALDVEGPPVGFLLRERGESGLGPRDLVRRCGCDNAQATASIAAIVASGRAVAIGDRVVNADLVAEWESGMLGALTEFHRAHPSEPGMTPSAVRDRLGQVLDSLVSAVQSRLIERGMIRGTEYLALSAHVPVKSEDQERLLGQVERTILDGALTPPDVPEIVSKVRGAAADVERAIHSLVREKRIVRTGGLLFHIEALSALRGAVQSVRAGVPAGGRATLDVATFKATFKLTRKHAIPLLEWLDRERITRRTGDVRIVL